MRKILALLPFAIFAACGSVDINLPDNADAGEGGNSVSSSSSSSSTGTSSGAPSTCDCERDGSRLKAQWLVGDDGSRMFMGTWHDSELNDNCWFQYLANGETRCVPGSAQINTYEDAACKIPVYGFTECTHKPKYAKIELKEPSVPGTCGQAITAIKYLNIDYGFPVSLSSLYAINANGACSPVSIPANTQFVKTNPLADSSWFVLAKEGM